jgi:mannose-6-phosphate isomerase-like protein (cupin superfamily)
VIIKKSEMKESTTDSCHGGAGELTCVELLGHYDRQGPGFRYFHDDTLAPGASIGEHVHSGDEEIYVVDEGHGIMIVDGESIEISAGDICVTRDGHSHGIINSTDGPMRLLVICTNV